MDASTRVAIGAALTGLAALYFNAMSVRAAKDQTAIQRQLRIDAAQPYVWADVRADRTRGSSSSWLWATPTPPSPRTSGCVLTRRYRRSTSSASLLMELRDRGACPDGGQALAEFAKVVHAACGPELLPRCQRFECNTAGLFQFSGGQVCIGQDYRGEEVAALEGSLAGRRYSD